MKSQNYNPRKRHSRTYTFFRTPQWLRTMTSQQISRVGNQYGKAQKWLSHKRGRRFVPWQKEKPPTTEQKKKQSS